MQADVKFRTLIVLAVSTFAIAFYVSIRAPLPDSYYPHIQWIGYGMMVPLRLSNFLYNLFVALDLAGLVLCFFFVRKAHLLLVASVLFSPLQFAIGGISIAMPFFNTFWAVHYIFYVLVVGMAMYDPIVSNRLRAKSVESISPN